MRPIDANTLVVYLYKATEECIAMENHVPEQFKEYYRGKMEAFIEVAAHVKRHTPTLDYAPKQQWISVKDRLPDGEDPVLIFVKETEHYGLHKEKRKVYYCQYLAYWDGDEWLTTWCNGCRKISDTAKEPYADDYEVVYWMPLPEPPKEETTND